MKRFGLLGLLVLLTALSASRAAEPELSRQRVQEAIDKVHARPLNSEKHMPWVIMHAVIAFEKDLDVIDSATGEKVNAIEFLLQRATWNGKSIWRNDNGRPWLPTRGMSEEIAGRSYLVQDHVDQYLFALGDAEVPLTAKFKTDDGKQFTLKDLFDVSKKEFKPTQELGWTLYCLAVYEKPDFQWTSADGVQWSTEKVAELASQRDANRETEGGPHHLYGVAVALAKWKEANPGKKPTGGWELAEEYVKYHVQLVKEFQNEDGTFSAAMFRGKAQPRNARTEISASGHTLEWLTHALTAEELRAEWVTRAVAHMVDSILANDVEAFSDGGIYHAVHSLRRYLEVTAK